MYRTSIIDKLEVLINIINKEPYMVHMIILFLILGIVLLCGTMLSKKRVKTIYISWYILMLLSIIIKYSNSLSSLLNYFMNNIVYELVFPNFIVYIGIFIISNIYVINSILTNKTNIYKAINVIMYIFMSYISFVLFNLITTNNINVYEELDIYSNSDITSLIELSMIIFSIWTILNIIYKIIYKVKRNTYNISYEPVNMDIISNIEVDNIEDNTTIDTNIEDNNIVVEDNITNNIVNPTLELELYDINDNTSFNSILNSIMSNSSLELLSKSIDNSNCSIDEYRILSNIIRNKYKNTIGKLNN